MAVEIAEPQPQSRARATVQHGGRARAGRVGVAALLALCSGTVLTFLALPLIALFAEVPLSSVPRLLSDPVVKQALEVTARTNAVANVLILGLGTPLAYLLATKRFPGRSLVVTLVE